MSYLDTLYRAFTDFRKVTEEDRECSSQRHSLAKSDADKDCVEVTRVVCTIEEDWINAIEEGLVHIEKALAEERQFIRAYGEVVPIEKVKRISRDSVEHLSRHGNLLSGKSNSDELVPEKLYTVERLNDYAVYENRFLYMLLTYLEEFISMRYTKIESLTNTYDGTLNINKAVNSRQNEITFKLNLEEKRQNDPIMKVLNPNKAIIERIGMLLKTVNHYLGTPLMEEVAKAAKLKPPITKTNVLKMDKNFKGAVKLYEFIAAYDKDGYTVDTVKKKLKISDVMSDEFAELYCLSSFFTYAYGMDIKDMLKANYEDEENRRRAVAEQQRLDKLRALRRRIKEQGENPEEYILLLEKQLRAFEGIQAKLNEQKAECDTLREEVGGLKNEIAALNDKLILLNAEHAQKISEINAVYERQINELKENCQSRINYITEQHRVQLEEQRDKYEREINETKSAHRDEIAAIAAEHDKILGQKQSEISELTAASAALEEKLAATIDELDDTVKSKDKIISDVKEENRLLADLKTLSDGRLNALKFQYGLMTDADDFTTEKAFNELEIQYNIFRRFFKSEWKKTKKKIRKELLRAHKEASDDAHSSDGIIGENIEETDGKAKEQITSDEDNA